MKNVENKISSMVFDCDIEAGNDDDNYEWEETNKLMAVIGDEDTCAGFMLGGIGELNEFQEPNYYVVYPKTEDFRVRFAFENFVTRNDIAIILITKEAAEKIHNAVKNYKRHVPALLVIPGHNGPYEVDLPREVQEIEERRASLSSRRGTESSIHSICSVKSIDPGNSANHKKREDLKEN